MNPFLDALKPYPFQRLSELLGDLKGNSSKHAIPLSLGEPRHAAPDFLVEMLSQQDMIMNSLGTYPATRGVPLIRKAISDWANRRYQLSAAPLDPETNVLPVSGTREGLFSIAQAVTDSHYAKESPTIFMPNPFYQIYEGASLLAGANPVFLNCTSDNLYQPDFSRISSESWQKCQLVYICSPGNPTGAILGMDTLKFLIEKAREFGFVLVSDECYSEIYCQEDSPPVGLLQACCEAGYSDYTNCIVFNSLSKRSNLPGLRSGFVAGDARILERYLLYRTYQGSAMPTLTQLVSASAWQDEVHVIANRQVYRDKLHAVHGILKDVMSVELPEAGFYLWPATPVDDELFTRQLFEAEHVTVLPGSYLSRQAEGINPGHKRVRMALVAPQDDCIEAAQRVASFLASGA